MAGPSGFTQRWQGKVLAKLLGVGSGGITLYSLTGAPNLTPADLYSIDGAATVTAYSTAGTQTIANPGGVDVITASSAISIFTLGSLPVLGVRKTLTLIVSSGVFIKAAAGSAFNSSTATVIKSTAALTNIELLGRSTANWEIMSVYPVSTLGQTLTLSTTT